MDLLILYKALKLEVNLTAGEMWPEVYSLSDDAIERPIKILELPPDTMRDLCSMAY